jgi:chromosome partitioning protein
MHIIAIAHEKGGVAKTTSAASLAGALVMQKKEVLLIDMDPQANLTLAMGIQPHKIRRSIADVLLNSVSPLTISKETNVPGIDIIPSNSDMGLAERFLPIRSNYRHILKHAIEGIDQYDFALIDCPPALGAITQNAITAANTLIIPTQAEYFSTYSLKNMMGIIHQIKQTDNPTLKYKVLITMLDGRINLHKTLSQQIENTFQTVIYETRIGIDSKLRECHIAGLPITHYLPRTRGAVHYSALAQEIIQDVEKQKVKQPA